MQTTADHLINVLKISKQNFPQFNHENYNLKKEPAIKRKKKVRHLKENFKY